MLTREELKRAHNNVMTVMENHIMSMVDCSRKVANMIANEVLNLDAEAERILGNISVGDTVKVIGTTDIGGIEKELIHIGTICKVIEVDKSGEVFCVRPINNSQEGYWYLGKDLEKSHMEWVKED